VNTTLDLHDKKLQQLEAELKVLKSKERLEPLKDQMK
jgi:hypothetical protein